MSASGGTVRPTRFQISKLFGSQNIDLSFPNNCSIIVGPNGIGKSSVANILYFLISRQWRRLLDYKFSNLRLWFDDQVIEVERDEISGLSRISEIVASIPRSSRYADFIARLQKIGRLEEFLGELGKSPRNLRTWKDLAEPGASIDEFRHFVFSLERRINIDDHGLFSVPRRNIESKLDELIPGRTLYLPTYRRIEKDLQEISPAFGQRFREALGADGELKLTRSSKYYVDLVSFGMNDVRTRIDEITRTLRDFSLEKFSELSGHYLKDVIRGKADEFDHAQIRQLSDDAISEILGRVSERILSEDDKSLLKSRILRLRNGSPEELSPQDSYLAHYFSRLVVVNDEI
ncbi:hypothetical protein, partial [Tabrizicola sp.]|uniref:hypothetical protein n=1 Tax=Tabrizicola sp. TaxID=2005166 RepID=UPI001A4AE066